MPNLTSEVYLVGKGLSLDYITEKEFLHDYDVICINESIQKINNLNIPNRKISTCKEKIPIKYINPKSGIIITPECNYYEGFKIFHASDKPEWETVNFILNYLIDQKVKVVHMLAFDFFLNGSNKYSTSVEREVYRDADIPILGLIVNNVINQTKGKIILNFVNTVRLIDASIPE